MGQAAYIPSDPNSFLDLHCVGQARVSVLTCTFRRAIPEERSRVHPPMSGPCACFKLARLQPHRNACDIERADSARARAGTRASAGRQSMSPGIAANALRGPRDCIALSVASRRRELQLALQVRQHRRRRVWHPGAGGGKRLGPTPAVLLPGEVLKARPVMVRSSAELSPVCADVRHKVPLPDACLGLYQV